MFGSPLAVSVAPVLGLRTSSAPAGHTAGLLLEQKLLNPLLFKSHGGPLLSLALCPQPSPGPSLCHSACLSISAGTEHRI